MLNFLGMYRKILPWLLLAVGIGYAELWNYRIENRHKSIKYSLKQLEYEISFLRPENYNSIFLHIAEKLDDIARRY
jgi:hypothetical protein